jgi:hypothetical protein
MDAPMLYCNRVEPERMECVWFNSHNKRRTFGYNPKTEYAYWDPQQQRYIANNIITDPPT